MSYDPNYPQAGTRIRAAEFRAQFGALHDENTALAVTVSAQAAMITTLQAQMTAQAAAAADLQARVAALENLPFNGISQQQLDDAIATRAPKPVGMSTLNFGAGPDYNQATEQGLFDFSATLLTALQGP